MSSGLQLYLKGVSNTGIFLCLASSLVRPKYYNDKISYYNDIKLKVISTFKGTVMQNGKALINVCLGVSKVS